MTSTVKNIDINLNLTPEEVFAVVQSFDLPSNVGRFSDSDYLKIEPSSSLEVGTRSLLTRQFAEQKNESLEVSAFVRSMVLICHLPEKSMMLAIKNMETNSSKMIEVHHREGYQVMHLLSDEGFHQFIQIRNPETILQTFQSYLELSETIAYEEAKISIEHFRAIKDAKGGEVAPIAEKIFSKEPLLSEKTKDMFVATLSQPTLAISAVIVKPSDEDFKTAATTILKGTSEIMINLSDVDQNATISTLNQKKLEEFLRNAGILDSKIAETN